MSDTPIFANAKAVVAAIGTVEYEEEPLNAITALQLALFHQSVKGRLLVSGNAMAKITGKLAKEGPLLSVPETMMFGLPVKLERLLAGAMYLMKEPRKKCRVKLMMQKLEFEKQAQLFNKKNWIKLLFAFEGDEWLGELVQHSKEDRFQFTLALASDG